MVSAMGGVAVLRVIGFASMVLGINHPAALAMQYIAIIAAVGLSLIAIAQAAVIEPPAFVVNAISSITDRLTRRFATA
jgi:hypothetical protein